jgi:hypothetical protein
LKLSAGSRSISLQLSAFSLQSSTIYLSPFGPSSLRSKFDIGCSSFELPSPLLRFCPSLSSVACQGDLSAIAIAKAEAASEDWYSLLTRAVPLLLIEPGDVISLDECLLMGALVA